MSYSSDPVSLGDKVRAVVACLVATEASSRVFVRVGYLAPGSVAPGLAPSLEHFWLKRIYTGEHKQLHGHSTVLVGFDAAADARTLTARTSTGWHAFEVEARTTPFDGVDLPFEGAFELKALAMPTPR